MAKNDKKISANHSSMDRMSRGDITFEVVNCILLGIVACIMLFPLIYVVSASFSDPMSVTSGKMILWPVDVTLENYKEVFKNDNIMSFIHVYYRENIDIPAYALEIVSCSL